MRLSTGNRRPSFHIILAIIALLFAALYSVGLVVDWPDWIRGVNWVWVRRVPQPGWRAVWMALAIGGGLLLGRTPHPWAAQGLELRAQGPAVVEHGNVGFLGYYAGPDVHIIDRNGLTDPLLARLPVRDPADWRIGHFRRNVPDGYIETLRSGQNQIHDPALAAYYDALVTITRGPLWDGARWRAIWRMNTGFYDDMLAPGE